MALQKEIELNNGIIIKYHRITSVNQVTNQSIIIEVTSYTSQEKREEEKQALKISSEQHSAVHTDIFLNTDYVKIPYKKNFTLEDAYEYLKKLEKYKGAINI